MSKLAWQRIIKKYFPDARADGVGKQLHLYLRQPFDIFIR